MRKGKLNPGAGRTPDWLKQKCQALIEKHKLIEFLADVASGECHELIRSTNGETIVAKRSCDPDTRLKAVNMLLERGFGKAAQPLEHSGDSGSRLIFIHPEHNP